MTRLINADALEALCSTPGLIHVAMIVKQQPTIDAVPVIRCKDCQHWYEKCRHGVDMSACKRAIGYFGANDYCSKAERKEE